MDVKEFRENVENLTVKKSFLYLERQLDNFSCGPASVNALHQISTYFDWQKPNSQAKPIIYDICKPLPVIGTDNPMIVKAMQVLNIPLSNHGENAWDGSVAVVNLKNVESGVGHFVVFLKRIGEDVVFFDPILSDIIKMRLNDIQWQNSDGSLIKWAANTGKFLSNMDLTKIKVKKAHFIITEPDENINLFYDVSTAIYQKLKQEDKQVIWSTIEQVRLRKDKMYVNSVKVRENDTVWIRLDPSATLVYYEFIRSLIGVKAFFINTPEAILKLHDKSTALKFRNDIVYRVFSDEQLKKVIGELRYRQLDKVIAKPPSSCGGKDIELCTLEDLLSKASYIINEYGYVIIEEFIKPKIDNEHTDVRGLWIRGHGFVGFVSRMNGEDSYKCNLTSGGSSNLADDFSIPVDKLEALHEFLTNQEGVYLAGVDWLNEQQITEINVSCPSVFLNWERDNNIDLMSLIVSINP